MTFDEHEVLGRFHRALVREIQAKNPEHISSPFTVAEIYQNLVPYRTHRDELSVEMNADYEHALLRLLAGEGDFLSIESRTARQEMTMSPRRWRSWERKTWKRASVRRVPLRTDMRDWRSNP
jgi:hypothetical protein